MSTTSTTRRGHALARQPLRHWRSIDLITAAVLGVAFGVVFWGWGVLYSVLDPLFSLFPPAAGLISGMFFLPAVVAALVVRRPGAALLAEMVAAAVEALLGSHWGLTVLTSGFVQGLAVEVAVALFAWKRWGVGVAVLGGALAGAFAAVWESIVYNAAWSTAWKLAYLGVLAVSGAVLAGLVGAALVRALARAGALRRFPAGAEHRATLRD